MSGRKKVEVEIEKMTQEELEADLTQEQRDFLAAMRRGKTDPVAFAEELLDIKLHDGQKLWLWMTTKTQIERAYELGLTLSDPENGRKLWANRAEFDALLERNHDFLKNILVPSNRWGKTFVTSVKHLWYNYYKIGVRAATPQQRKEVRCGTLNLSPHSNQCQAGYEHILDILFSRLVYTVLEDGVQVSRKNNCKIGNFYVSDNGQKRTILFKNGTFYKAIPTGEDQASSLAGNPYLYISYDECAQSLHLKAELPAKIMSRLIDFGGPLDLVSTPEVDKPSHQYFFHIAKLGLEGKDGWFTLIGKLSDNIFLGSKEVANLTDAIKSTDPVKYRQVVYGEFVTTGKKMFDTILIERIWDRNDASLPELEHNYLLVADWGFADTGDPTVFYVLDYTQLFDEKIPKHLRKIRIAYRDSIKGGSPYAVLAEARILQRTWNGAKFLHDSSSMGGVIIRKMLTETGMQDINDFSATGDKADMLFVFIVVLSANREVEMSLERKIVDKNPDFGRLRGYHIPPLEEQMGIYQYNPAKGITDKKIEQDEVMCLGMGLWFIERKIMKNTLKQADWNPFAQTTKQIFPDKSVSALAVRSITIPEKRIF